MVNLSLPNQSNIRDKRRSRDRFETPWRHNRRVLEDVLGAIGIEPSEKYPKSIPYMQVLRSMVHWCGEWATVTVGMEGSGLWTLADACAAEGRSIAHATAADRFADHWRSTGFEHLVLAYPERLADLEPQAQGYRLIERDTARIPEFLARGLDRGAIQQAFYFAPGQAAEVCEMMLDGLHLEYIRAALGVTS